ncbi:hypothetical protein M407DRAFT_204477 [Tulasnella calospora MUT 4182]|uniref:Exportin-2 C-terminal domain-containing protein n=1 Tax=Tulasnella calospora MUT 4182 TaxID=1051891 RepID=A0A0C3QW68_9AGAM|nr:hypothetical protein M407DRAFT_204477 [Tulasnella calospora MUT 4182]
MRPLDRKTVAVGLTRLITESQLMLSSPPLWQPAFLALEQLVSRADAVAQEQAEDPEAILTAIDYEEATAGYQASFSKLAASQPKRYDPVEYVPDLSAYVKQTLAKAVAADTRARALLALPSATPWSRALQTGQAF